MAFERYLKCCEQGRAGRSFVGQIRGRGGALLSVKSEGGGCSSEIPPKFTRILGTKGLILARIIIENNEQEKS